MTMDSVGNAWVVNEKGEIFSQGATSWNPIVGYAQDIAISKTGQMHMCAKYPDSMGVTNLLHKWNSTTSSWDPTTKRCIKLAAGHEGAVETLWYV
jgi:hypothetical protein